MIPIRPSTGGLLPTARALIGISYQLPVAETLATTRAAVQARLRSMESRNGQVRDTRPPVPTNCPWSKDDFELFALPGQEMMTEPLTGFDGG